MTFLLSLGLLLAANAGATDPSSRCSLLAGEAPQQWLAKERIRPLPDHQSLIHRARARAWVPTMRVSIDSGYNVFHLRFHFQTFHRS